MTSRFISAGVLAATCVSALAGGYVAVRHNGTADPTPAATVHAAAVPVPAVAETEAPIGPAPAAAQSLDSVEVRTSEPIEAVAAPRPRPVPAAASRPARTPRPRANVPPPAAAPAPPAAPAPATPAAAAPAAVYAPEPALPVEAPAAAPAAIPEPPPAPAAPVPVIEEVVVPAASVVGLQVETSLSSEHARVEDRVDARVTRDVLADGRVAIPAGSRVIGGVTLVEKGGKMKERARLGVRFHTLVLADGTRVPLRTEAIVREGEPPSRESARKIGGAAIGGAILGAILGGGKGAAIGGAAGAGAGSAAVMAGDRNAATLPSGTIVTARLAAPVTLELERR